MKENSIVNPVESMEAAASAEKLGMTVTHTEQDGSKGLPPDTPAADDKKEENGDKEYREQITALECMTPEEILDKALEKFRKSVAALRNMQMEDAVDGFIRERLETDPGFAKKFANPRKKMANCYHYIYRMAAGQLEELMKARGREMICVDINGRPAAASNISIDNQACFNWALEYFDKTDVEEDKPEPKGKISPSVSTRKENNENGKKKKASKKPSGRKTPEENPVKDKESDAGTGLTAVPNGGKEKENSGQMDIFTMLAETPKKEDVYKTSKEQSGMEESSDSVDQNAESDKDFKPGQNPKKMSASMGSQESKEELPFDLEEQDNRLEEAMKCVMTFSRFKGQTMEQFIAQMSSDEAAIGNLKIISTKSGDKIAVANAAKTILEHRYGIAV